MPIGHNFSASNALLRAKQLAAEADGMAHRATDIEAWAEAQASASVATALATVAMAMRQPES